jgi:tetratricopeptide (TPR) repeat protein
MGVAVALYDAGELDAAINNYRRALDLFERVEDRSFELSVLHSLATIQFERGATAEARELAERAIALAKMCGDTRVEATAQVVLARIMLADGDAENALELAKTAEKTLSVDRVQRADALRVMGAAHDTLGAHPASDKAYRKSIELLTEIDDRPDRSAIAAEYAQRLRARGDVDTAFQYMELARGR